MPHCAGSEGVPLLPRAADCLRPRWSDAGWECKTPGVSMGPWDGSYSARMLRSCRSPMGMMAPDLKASHKRPWGVPA